MPVTSSEPLLDMVVKLAAFGATGVGIIVIIWSGWLISRLPPGAGKEMHHTIRLFMAAGIALSFISGGFGVWNAQIKASTIQRQQQVLKSQAETIETKSLELSQTNQRLAEASDELARTKSLSTELLAKTEQLLAEAPQSIPEPVTVELQTISKELREVIQP